MASAGFCNIIKFALSGTSPYFQGSDHKHTYEIYKISISKRHLSKKESEWSDNDNNQIMWPSQSLDLNVVEMVCDKLDQRVKEVKWRWLFKELKILNIVWV